jgi:tetratricopeptide (TPR) repeat protein
VQAQLAEVKARLAESKATATAVAIAQAEQAQVEAQATAAAAPTATAEALEVHYQKGLGYMNIGRWEEAEAELEQVFEVDPNYKEVQGRLAELKARLSEMCARTPTLVQRTFQLVPLGSLVNIALDAYFTDPPVGQITLGGIPFQIPSAGDNIFLTQGCDGHDTNPTSAEVYTNVSYPKGIYFLLNAVCPKPANATMGRLIFRFDDGSSFTKELVIGQNIRDYYLDTQADYVTVVTDPGVQQAWSGRSKMWGGRATIDMLTVPLPEWCQVRTLVAVAIEDTSLHGTDSIGPGIMLVGMTVESLPELP